MSGAWGGNAQEPVTANWELTTDVRGSVPPRSIALSDAPIAIWHGARQRGETGLAAFRGVSATLLWEIPALPDFSSARFSDLTNLEASARTAQVAKSQAELIQVLTSQGLAAGYSLRYLKASGSERLRLFFAARVTGQSEDEATELGESLQQAVESAVPRGYTLVRRDLGDLALKQVATPNATGYSELLKIEQWEEAWHDPNRTGFRFWYGVQNLAPNSGNDMLAFCQALVRLPGSFLFDVTPSPHKSSDAHRARGASDLEPPR